MILNLKFVAFHNACLKWNILLQNNIIPTSKTSFGNQQFNICRHDSLIDDSILNETTAKNVNHFWNSKKKIHIQQRHPHLLDSPQPPDFSTISSHSMNKPISICMVMQRKCLKFTHCFPISSNPTGRERGDPTAETNWK